MAHFCITKPVDNGTARELDDRVQSILRNEPFAEDYMSLPRKLYDRFGYRDAHDFLIWCLTAVCDQEIALCEGAFD